MTGSNRRPSACKADGKHKERWLGEVKTFESDETRKECNEFSRAK
ncbi:hypothetical protein AAGW44_13590 [Staphylococcus aureus]